MNRAKHPHALAGAAISVACFLATHAAQASMFKGETLDAVANGIAWVVLVLVPIIAISVLADQEQTLEFDQQACRIGRQDLRSVQQQQQQVQSARMALLRVQSEQLIQRVNLHLALGGSFAEPVTVAATTPK